MNHLNIQDGSAEDMIAQRRRALRGRLVFAVHGTADPTEMPKGGI